MRERGYLSASSPLRCRTSVMPALPTLLPTPDSAIRQATDSVFSAAEFNRTSLWERIVGWVAEQLFRLLSLLWSDVHGSRTLSLLLVVLGATVLIGIAIRAVMLGAERRRAADAYARGVSMGGTDPWRAAQELAAAGRFTDAAHALYVALLDAAARHNEVALHPSKTAGDYIRELRARSSSLLGRFREFARSYELVIYGVGVCDRERYEQLLHLAQPIIRPHG